jgi:hypothetical protein
MAIDLKDLTALAAATIAASLAAAKLVADKESKVSDFRKDWITTFRAALSECLAEAHVIAGRIRIRAKHVRASGADGLGKEDRETLEKDLTEHWAAYRQSYRTVLLHLNFAETSLPLFCDRLLAPAIERTPQAVWNALRGQRPSMEGYLLDVNHPQAVDPLSRATPAAIELVAVLESLLAKLLGMYDQLAEDAHYDLIDVDIMRATLLGNLVIKPEWNRIKKGERLHHVAIGFSLAVVIAGFVGFAYSIASNAWTDAASPVEKTKPLGTQGPSD